MDLSPHIKFVDLSQMIIVIADLLAAQTVESFRSTNFPNGWDGGLVVDIPGYPGYHAGYIWPCLCCPYVCMYYIYIYNCLYIYSNMYIYIYDIIIYLLLLCMYKND